MKMKEICCYGLLGGIGMKKTGRLWIIAFVAVIGFSLTTCGSDNVPVTGVTLDQTALTITVGETATLTATVDPEDATNKAVTWSSSKNSVATVSNGTVTGVSAGTATITVKTRNGSKTDTCEVTVTSSTTSAITYTAIQVGGTDGVTNTTGITFTFSASVDSLNLTAADITVSGKAEKSPSTALSGSGTTRTLAITVIEAGNATVKINKTGIEAETKNVTVFKAGQTAPPFENDVTTLTVTNTTEWENALSLISSGGNNKAYTITVNGNVGVTGRTTSSFGLVTGLSLTLKGSGKLYLTDWGNLIRIARYQTVIIDSEALILQGLKNGQNNATQNNNTSVVYVDGGSFTMNDGEISGNTTYYSGGGVYLGDYGTFTMNGGKISNNTATNYGGVALSGGTFTMNDGEISGNSASSNGGGVNMIGNGIFRIVSGTVYGSNASPATLGNTATSGAALFNLGGTAERGTFNGETWIKATNGDLTTTNDTIKVANGAIVP